MVRPGTARDPRLVERLQVAVHARADVRGAREGAQGGTLSLGERVA
jgi:hypothetical protein